MLAVMGVLKTERGLLIKDRISNYLNPRFDILYIEQDPPGRLFEYPGIKYALKLAIEMDEPVLYIHTKGAADPHHMWYQTPVKKLWEHEFGTAKVEASYKKVCCKEPYVICPIAGNEKQTWWNGMIINPAAANLILPTLKTPNVLTDNYVSPNSRWYYEEFMCRIHGLSVISSAVEGTHNETSTNILLQNLTKNLPEIDY